MAGLVKTQLRRIEDSAGLYLMVRANLVVGTPLWFHADHSAWEFQASAMTPLNATGPLGQSSVATGGLPMPVGYYGLEIVGINAAGAARASLWRRWTNSLDWDVEWNCGMGDQLGTSTMPIPPATASDATWGTDKAISGIKLLSHSQGYLAPPDVDLPVTWLLFCTLFSGDWPT